MSWGPSVASSFWCCLPQFFPPNYFLTSRLSPCCSQNQLLEIGWNKSEATQVDVEKTLNCCGFSYVNPNGTCAAVGVFFFFVLVSSFNPILSSTNVLHFLMIPLPPHPPRAAFTSSRCPAPRAHTSSSSMLETCCGSSAASGSSSVSPR